MFKILAANEDLNFEPATRPMADASCFRISHSHTPEAFHGMFTYLEDTAIMKDKAGMWQCISAVVIRAFKLYLDLKMDMVSNSAINIYILLILLFIYLFCNICMYIAI